MRTLLIAVALALGVAGAARAQPASPPAPPPAPPAPANPYDPQATFAPLDFLPSPSRYRSGDGAPGPDYWQNRADYVIAARLEPKAKTLTAEETITYTNNSPDVLDVLWVQLDQNIYRKDARSGFSSGRPRTQFTDGYVLDS
ncbi:MAG TPA: hypothetical protein VE309_08265, partial [Caulobacteraceae bacterium]|nr:hypothetical protein [Caulobacteraceae bacterium]